MELQWLILALTAQCKKNLLGYDSLRKPTCFGIFTFNIHLVNVSEPHKNCRVMSSCFRFSIITSSWSELAWVLRSVRRAMLRRSIFFPLKRHPKHSVTSLKITKMNAKMNRMCIYTPVVNHICMIRFTMQTASYFLAVWRRSIQTTRASIPVEQEFRS